MIRAALVGAVFGLFGIAASTCSRPVSPTPVEPIADVQPVDASYWEAPDASQGEQWCKKLVTFGCPEGRLSTCADVLESLDRANQKEVFDGACMTRAGSKHEAQACGLRFCP